MINYIRAFEIDQKISLVGIFWEILIAIEWSQAGIREGYLEVSRLQVVFKKAVSKNFPIFIGKHLCWSLF